MSSEFLRVVSCCSNIKIVRSRDQNHFIFCKICHCSKNCVMGTVMYFNTMIEEIVNDVAKNYDVKLGVEFSDDFTLNGIVHCSR